MKNQKNLQIKFLTYSNLLRALCFGVYKYTTYAYQLIGERAEN